MTASLLRRGQPVPAEGNPYDRFGFTENPFPDSPTVTPGSSDPRLNGDIYCDALRTEEEKQFERLLVPRMGQPEARPMAFLMDYATRRGRGIGKTAFLNHQRRRIMADLGDQLTDGAYVLLAAHLIPDGGGRTRKSWQFFRLIARSLNTNLCIASAIWRLRAFSGVIPEEALAHVDSQDLQTTLGNDRWLEEEHNISIMFVLRPAVERALLAAGVREETACLLAEYGHSPEAWERQFLSRQSDYYWRREGHSLVFDDLVRVFKAAEINQALLLVDEVEKIVSPQNKQERRAFADDLRRFFVDGPYQSVYTRFYNVLWAIHPLIQELWSPYWYASGLDRVCPIVGGASKEYTIYFYPFLDAEGVAVPLVKTYLDYFRTSAEQKGRLEPFDEQAVVEALRLSGGLPGPMLNLLRLTLERAVRGDWEAIRADQIKAIYESYVPVGPIEEEGAESMPPAQVDLRGDGEQ